ncbi:MAG TPA: transposase [Phycisphaerae bacterium]|nr:transposase [Phycisphaerae bacterium]
MPNYRRSRVEGAAYFFTLVTYRRRRIFDAPVARKLLRRTMRAVRAEAPWRTEAVVLLPDHLHLMWRMPDGDADYSGRIARIKKDFTKAYMQAGFGELPVSPGERRKRYHGVWQPRFWEHTIRDARDFKLHLDYIHMNPVKHGWVRRAADWPWSSFHRYVRLGEYELDWHGRVELPGQVEYYYPE